MGELNISDTNGESSRAGEAKLLVWGGGGGQSKEKGRYWGHT